MKNALKTLIVGILLSSTVALAEIPEGLLAGQLGNACTRQEVSQFSHGAVKVVDAVRCDTLYDDHQFLELEVYNLTYHKEFYFYDHGHSYHYLKGTKGKVFGNVSDPAVVSNFLYGTPVLGESKMIYLGKTEAGNDRFVVRLTSAFRSKPAPLVEVYVKMKGQQFEVTGIRLTP